MQTNIIGSLLASLTKFDLALEAKIDTFLAPYEIYTARGILATYIPFSIRTILYIVVLLIPLLVIKLIYPFNRLVTLIICALLILSALAIFEIFLGYFQLLYS